MEIAAIAVVLMVWDIFSPPECVKEFKEDVVVSINNTITEGELTSYYKCDDVVVLERLGEK